MSTFPDELPQFMSIEYCVNGDEEEFSILTEGITERSPSQQLPGKNQPTT